MKENKILAVIKEVGKNPYVKDIPAKLEAFQEIVGGYIEAVAYTSKRHKADGILCICNEEGKIKGLQPNFFVGGSCIVGNVFFVGNDGGCFTSLTPKQIDALLAAHTKR